MKNLAWNHLAQHGMQCRAFLATVTILQIEQNFGEILRYLSDC
jgi:hypothetical protein